MTGTIDSKSYDRFDFKHYDQTPLDLPGAVQRAEELRKGAPGYVYRVIPADTQSSRFYVDKLTFFEMYVEWASKMASSSARLFSIIGSKF